MSLVDSPLAYAWGAAITANTYLLQHLSLEGLLDLHFRSSNVRPLTDTPTAFFVRRDRFDRQRRVNVFTSDGTKLYTFERKSAFNPVWMMYTFPQRREVATIRAGAFGRGVDWHNKVGLEHRKVFNDSGLGGRYRSFYLTDGAKYQWSRGSKALERVLNPYGGAEEVRTRVAKVKLLRQFKMDFEVLVDEAVVDREVVLATGLISMLTQWGYGDGTDTVGPTFVPKASPEGEPQPKAGSDAVPGDEPARHSTAPTPPQMYLVIDGDDPSMEYTLEPLPAS